MAATMVKVGVAAKGARVARAVALPEAEIPEAVGKRRTACTRIVYINVQVAARSYHCGKHHTWVGILAGLYPTLRLVCRARTPKKRVPGHYGAELGAVVVLAAVVDMALTGEMVLAMFDASSQGEQCKTYMLGNDKICSATTIAPWHMRLHKE
mmetsp:Transcript_67235/g.111790  ORF Transcript_67235/g.111790 Transcript_67235/m.111790 type:complete len:153 (-) Transcript_67235:173-631(-)